MQTFYDHLTFIDTKLLSITDEKNKEIVKKLPFGINFDSLHMFFVSAVNKKCQKDKNFVPKDLYVRFFLYICKIKQEEAKILEQSSDCLIKKFFNTMKKTLLTLGAVAAMSFAFVACGDDTKDCECALTVLGVDTGVKAEVNEFDGDCDEISFDDLDSKTQDGLTAADVELNCEEK